jgi:NADH dehydrogenase
MTSTVPRNQLHDWAAPDPRRPRIIVIGAGFAGLYAARELRKAHEADVLVLDRTNHHLFQPLLYQVATAVLAPSDITSPVRSLLRKQRNTTVLLADVHSVDVERKVVVADGGTGVREVSYDYLIVAAGSSHS